MFNFVINWIRNRQRQIFRFWDGHKVRGADPIVVWRALLSHPEFEITRDTALMEVSDFKIADGARQRIVAATRTAFGVESLAGGGLTEDETVDLFKAFCVYAAELKKNSSNTPISSEPTPTANILPGNFGQHWEDTPPSAASTSTPAESNFDAPARLQTG
jgi:hypothetical protein